MQPCAACTQQKAPLELHHSEAVQLLEPPDINAVSVHLTLLFMPPPTDLESQNPEP